MSALTIDRTDLPKPHGMPLSFVLTDGNRTLIAEVSREAALEYIEAGIGPHFLAFQRREDFLQAVEAAVERRIDADDVAEASLTLGWSDLYPE